jgi:hypothetical protein
MIPIRVDCHSGYTYVDRPAALYWEEQRLEIAKIIQRWRTPSGWMFLVQTDNERAFEITYDASLDSWFGREVG